MLHDPAGWDAAFAVTQLLLGAGLLWRRSVRAALAASIGWAPAVWLGEGLGGVLSGTASPLSGAPGARSSSTPCWPRRPGPAAGPAAPWPHTARWAGAGPAGLAPAVVQLRLLLAAARQPHPTRYLTPLPGWPSANQPGLPGWPSRSPSRGLRGHRGRLSRAATPAALLLSVRARRRGKGGDARLLVLDVTDEVSIADTARQAGTLSSSAIRQTAAS